MSATKFSSRFEWLIDRTAPPRFIDQDGGGALPMPLPATFGAGWLENLSLAVGMSLFHVVARLADGASSDPVDIVQVTTRFDEPTFRALAVVKGRLHLRDTATGKEHLITPGRDLFRYGDQHASIWSFDASSDLELMNLSVSRSVMDALLGEQVASDLLKQLGLAPPSSEVLLAVPLAVSTPLHQALRSEYAPELRVIHAQARSLDYLTNLAVHLLGAGSGATHRADRRRRAQDVHDYLMEVEGRFPTLVELSRVFGRSARTLNDDFLSEFGDTIFGFMSNRRLTMAHEVIANSDIALKKVADMLGYTHVNNFSAAFRRKFGYAPGALRRKKAPTQHTEVQQTDNCAT